MVSFYCLEDLCQNLHLTHNIPFLPFLTSADPEHYSLKLCNEIISADQELDFESGCLGKFVQHHVTKKTEIIDTLAEINLGDNDDWVDVIASLHIMFFEEFEEWLVPFQEWRIQHSLSENGAWPYVGYFDQSHFSKATMSLLCNHWIDELDASISIAEIKNSDAGSKWFDLLYNMTASIHASAFLIFTKTNLSPEFFIFCLMEDKPTAFVKNYFEKIDTHTFLSLPGDITTKQIVNYYDICREFVRLRDRFDSGKKLVEKLIQQEESIVYEYKASFQTPVPEVQAAVNDKGQKVFKLSKQEFSSQKQVKEFLKFQCLKAIAGFLNTRGGTLIIGVLEESGDNKVQSIENEWGYEGEDKYQRDFIQEIVNHFGKSIAGDYINTKIHDFNGKKIMEVTVLSLKRAQGTAPVFLKEKLYKRTGPRTDELLGSEIAKFTLEFQKPDFDKSNDFDFINDSKYARPRLE